MWNFLQQKTEINFQCLLISTDKNKVKGMGSFSALNCMHHKYILKLIQIQCTAFLKASTPFFETETSNQAKKIKF